MIRLSTLAVTALGLCLAATAGYAQIRNPISIAKASVTGLDTSASTLTIEGQNFGDAPKVFFGAPGGVFQQLAILQSSDAMIVAALNAVGTGAYVALVQPGTGFQSASIDVTVGSMGPVGPMGPIGPAGPAGVAGPAGPAGPTGPAGTQGAQGSQGPAGVTGPTGPQGPQGPQGPTGTAGAKGAAGPAGPTGATGATGAQGLPGTGTLNGTTNFLTKFTSASVGGNSSIFDNGTSIGIGTSAPAAPVHIVKDGTLAGLVADNPNAANDAILGRNTAASGTSTGSGIVGITAQANASAAGVWGSNSGSSGTGVVGVGNNVSATVSAGGSGGAFTGSVTGAYLKTTDPNKATQVLYTSDGVGTVVRVNYWNGSTQYKINGSGSVSTHVADPTDLSGRRRITLHAPETPEIYFMDFGSGRLVNGRAHIDLDPRLFANIAVDERHPLRVFIQLEEDENTRGVVVKNKTATGFDVVEIGGGKGNQPFQWQVVANRADERLGEGRISRNADARFETLEENLPESQDPRPSRR